MQAAPFSPASPSKNNSTKRTLKRSKSAKPLRKVQSYGYALDDFTVDENDDEIEYEDRIEYDEEDELEKAEARLEKRRRDNKKPQLGCAGPGEGRESTAMAMATRNPRPTTRDPPTRFTGHSPVNSTC